MSSGPEPYLSQVAMRLHTSADFVECSLCYESTQYVGVGQCGHEEICWLCSLRLLWICKDKDCAICKEPIGSLSIRRVSSNVGSNTDHVFREVRFSDDGILKEAKRLVSYTCPFPCGEDPVFNFRSLSDLQTHLKRDHDGQIFCSICLDHRQSFLPEQPLFGPTELTAHNKSEHPSCDFCSKEKKFYSTDELMVHMNQAHFKCVVCDRLDYRNEYYANFDSLDKHFEESHFRCEYPECREQRFVVFGEEEDLRLHWLEKHGRGRAISLGGGSVGIGGRKKFRNRYSQTPVNLVVHFRGPRVPSTAPSDHDAFRLRDQRYPDLHHQEGSRYDRRIHSKIIEAKPRWMSVLSALVAKSTFSLTAGSEAYQAANVSFLKRISESVPKEAVWEIKAVSVRFTQGSISELMFLTQVRDLLGKLNDQYAVTLMADLITLMPDESKRDRLVSFLNPPPPRHSKPNKKATITNSQETIVEIPDGLFEPGSKKPCLLQALNAVIESWGDQTSIPQSILAAMENKINGLDRVELSTLSDMRQQLLTLAEGRVKDLSWSQVDSILSLRPLLYRVMQIPETHRSKERELLAAGWTTFVQATRNALSKFCKTEIGWMKAYVALSVVRFNTMGVTETRRHDFPSLPMSAYFPSVGEASQSGPSLPTRQDFPVGLPMAPPISSLMPTAASTTQWRNSTQALRDEAFPELITPVVISTQPDMSKPWGCSRCTFRNTRPQSRSCEICGMERPATGDDSEAPPQSPELGSANVKPKRSKQKIILSSSTQRDYTR